MFPKGHEDAPEASQAAAQTLNFVALPVQFPLVHPRSGLGGGPRAGGTTGICPVGPPAVVPHPRHISTSGQQGCGLRFDLAYPQKTPRTPTTIPGYQLRCDACGPSFSCAHSLEICFAIVSTRRVHGLQQAPGMHRATCCGSTHVCTIVLQERGGHYCPDLNQAVACAFRGTETVFCYPRHTNVSLSHWVYLSVCPRKSHIRQAGQGAESTLSGDLIILQLSAWQLREPGQSECLPPRP